MIIRGLLVMERNISAQSLMKGSLECLTLLACLNREMEFRVITETIIVGVNRNKNKSKIQFQLIPI